MHIKILSFMLLSKMSDGSVKKVLSLCLIKHHAMTTYRGSGGIVPLIL